MPYRYFTSDSEPDEIENATHNTFPKKCWLLKLKYPAFFENVLWVSFSIPSGSLSVVKYFKRVKKRLPLFLKNVRFYMHLNKQESY
jgi:hypothetical protein